MAEAKTQPTTASVDAFLAAVEDQERRRDCQTLLKLMKKATGEKPKMWGPSIVGFGSYHYHYASGREGDWMLVGFSPRKRDLTVYILPNLDRYGALLKNLGPHKIGKSCLYLKRLTDVDLAVLGKLIEQSVEDMKARHA